MENKSIEKNMPKWFCGGARLWESLSELNKLDDEIRASRKYKKPLEILLMITGACIIPGGMIFSATSMSGTPLVASLVGGMATIVSSYLLVQKSDYGTNGYGLIALWKGRNRKRVMGDAREQLKKLSDEEITNLINVGNAARVSFPMGSEDAHIGDITAACATDERNDRSRKERDSQNNRDKISEEIRKNHAEAFKNEKGEPVDFGLERILLELEETGADGLAALSLAKGMEKTDLSTLDKSELTRVTEILIPGLVKAFQEVPEDERGKAMEHSDKTPTEAMTEGLAAALERVLTIKRRVVEQSKMKVEMESAVITAGVMKQ